MRRPGGKREMVVNWKVGTVTEDRERMQEEVGGDTS